MPHCCLFPRVCKLLLPHLLSLVLAMFYRAINQFPWHVHLLPRLLSSFISGLLCCSCVRVEMKPAADQRGGEKVLIQFLRCVFKKIRSHRLIHARSNARGESPSTFAAAHQTGSGRCHELRLACTKSRRQQCAWTPLPLLFSAKRWAPTHT